MDSAIAFQLNRRVVAMAAQTAVGAPVAQVSLTPKKNAMCSEIAVSLLASRTHSLHPPCSKRWLPELQSLLALQHFRDGHTV